MIVYTSGNYYQMQSGERWVECLCPACKEPIGFLTPEEIAWHLANGQPMICFRCDTLRDDEIPNHLLPEMDEAVITKDEKGNEKRVTFWLNNGQLISVRVHNEAIPLSTSLTNLHAEAAADPEKEGEQWG